ncbi:pirin family protein [Pseudomonas sp. TTU2014-080ASC]|uniref:pirin family protein n=1 Tax=Pseudomonas sp. TTU2014-080ASC TaxID=1729724 RepID=UPI0007186E8A|nr:pirin family protein [Pseudomonas sp. TTU2014-080ASC]KRW61665.1 quercetin 2,3-dioxygenase [Pseudomonas sp. TTU2014-080ASC]
MSNRDVECELYTSADCPVENGVRQIQRITARGATIGGGIRVSRVLPDAQRKTIGAWCFLDHAGPAEFFGSEGLDVGPHPHIGLQTFTWMIRGEGLHRDSLGNEQMIRPGQVNLMTAGRGIVHTEESPEGERHLHAAQLWIALPKADKDCDPAFDHYPDLPVWVDNGLQFTLVAGAFEGRKAPTRIFSPLMGVDLSWQVSGSSQLSLDKTFEYGVLVLEGSVRINGQDFTANELAFVGRGLTEMDIQAEQGARALLLGGEPFEGPIYLWWNFVGHSKADIQQALADWNSENTERFGHVPGYNGERLTAPRLPD